MGHQDIAIGELSRRTGCTIETIRYYERIGLLPKPSRRGTYRRYEPEDVGRLAFVRRARELGFTLEAVRTLLTLASEGQDACPEVREIAAAHLSDVRVRIADLRAMEVALAQEIRGCESGEMAVCPMISSLSSAGARA